MTCPLALQFSSDLICWKRRCCGGTILWLWWNSLSSVCRDQHFLYWRGQSGIKGRPRDVSLCDCDNGATIIRQLQVTSLKCKGYACDPEKQFSDRYQKVDQMTGHSGLVRDSLLLLFDFGLSNCDKSLNFLSYQWLIVFLFLCFCFVFVITSNFMENNSYQSVLIQNQMSTKKDFLCIPFKTAQLDLLIA